MIPVIATTGTIISVTKTVMIPWLPALFFFFLFFQIFLISFIPETPLFYAPRISFNLPYAFDILPANPWIISPSFVFFTRLIA